jgi:hypothetical protein
MIVHLQPELGHEVEKQIERGLHPTADHLVYVAVTRYLAGVELGLTEQQGQSLLDATRQAHRYDDEPEDLREQFSRMSVG